MRNDLIERAVFDLFEEKELEIINVKEKGSLLSKSPGIDGGKGT